MMSFGDYKSISQVQAEFRIKYQENNFIALENYNISWMCFHRKHPAVKL